ncbi:hypothetical protein [Haliangium sp.]|uniref:hypothetical protein n=1 Tax=Haliangium sp. TaxID=2663208 RepID=UPI003D0AD4E6
MAHDSPPQQLTKEVLTPQTPYSGLGVVLVASLAMMMALASSAFVVSARMSKRCPTRAVAPEVALPVAQDWSARPAPTQPAPALAPSEDACGPTYRALPGNVIEVDFRVCPRHGEDGRLSLDQLRLALPDAPEGIEVRRIVR